VFVASVIQTEFRRVEDATQENYPDVFALNASDEPAEKTERAENEKRDAAISLRGGWLVEGNVSQNGKTGVS
jgi:hypothetical protein